MRAYRRKNGFRQFLGSNLAGGLARSENVLKSHRGRQNRVFQIFSDGYDPLTWGGSTKLFAIFSTLNNSHWVVGCKQVRLCVIALRGTTVR